MKTNRFIVIISFLLLHYVYTNAQSKMNFHLDMNLYAHYNKGMWSGQAYMIYSVSSKIGLGGGVELIGTRDDYTSVPVFATVHYAPIKNVYLFVDGKVAPIQRDNDIASGVMASVGCGYTKMFSRKIGMNFKIGYNKDHLVRKDYTDNVDALLIGLGFVF